MIIACIAFNVIFLLVIEFHKYILIHENISFLWRMVTNFWVFILFASNFKCICHVELIVNRFHYGHSIYYSMRMVGVASHGALLSPVIRYSKRKFEYNFSFAWIKRAKIRKKREKKWKQIMNFPFKCSNMQLEKLRSPRSTKTERMKKKKAGFIQIVSKQNWFFILLMWFIVILLFAFTDTSCFCTSNALSQKYWAARFHGWTIKMFVCVLGAYVRSIMHIEFHHQLTRKMMSSTRFPAYQYHTKYKWLRYVFKVEWWSLT